MTDDKLRCPKCGSDAVQSECVRYEGRMYFCMCCNDTSWDKRHFKPKHPKSHRHVDKCKGKFGMGFRYGGD